MIGEPLMVALAACGLAVVVVRRRSVAIALVAAQSLALGVVAVADGLGESAALSTAGIALVAKAVALPALLVWVVRRTREPRLIVEERHALSRAVAAAAVTLALVALVPQVVPHDPAAQKGAVALLALGIAIAVLRRSAIFQALGFLVAENGLYVAALIAPGGLPAVIELGLVFDLVVVVVVAAAFSAKIHEHLGTGDTGLLGELRD
jgi:hydrogenase-4 component E